MSGKIRNVVLIGATGSIGCNVQRVVEANPDRLRFVALANRSKCRELDEAGRKFGVKTLCCVERDGEAALSEIATMPEADIVVMAAGGTVCLHPTLAAIEAGKDIALASKEVLVMAGEFVMEAARRRGVKLLPVDSEHNAIFQCLDGRGGGSAMKRILLTASGGPFLNSTLEQMATVTPEQALKHPKWSMGQKISIDSATMANKGLEMIEARWLFDAQPEQISVVIHPQSIVHSMVEFADGSTIAQMSPPSMTFAIQHTLLYPERIKGVDGPLDFTKRMELSFMPPDEERFRALTLAREAMRTGMTAPAIYNAANEIAVDAFMKRQIPFLAIPALIEHTLSSVPIERVTGIDGLTEIDAVARRVASDRIKHEF